MVFTVPQFWQDLLEADSFSEIAHAGATFAHSLLGANRFAENWFLLHESSGQPAWWVLLTDLMAPARFYLDCPLRDEIIHSTAQHAGIQTRLERPDQLMRHAMRPPTDGPEFLPGQTLIMPLGTDACQDGAWLIHVKNHEPVPEEIRKALEEGGRMISMIQSRILKCERINYLNVQLHQLHEEMQQALAAGDEPELFNACLRVATRNFRFDRAMLALFNKESGVLHTAVHTGFGDTAPGTVLSRKEHDFFLPLLRRGEVVLMEAAPQSGAWPDYGPIIPFRRALLPLTNGLLGILYADQFDPAGNPLYREVLELFARQTAVALENLKLRLQAERRAETDSLTGLHNRAYLDRLLELEIPRVRRYNHPISLLMIDLCDFKRVNDTWGHLFGDSLLRETAQLLKVHVRQPDVVVRYGGDEFVVVMVNTDQAQAEQVRQRIEKAFINRNRLQEDERRMIHISTGLRSADARSLDDLLYDADQAMYAQKAQQKRRQLLEALVNGAPERIEAADKVVGNLCLMLYKKAPYYVGHARRVAAVSILLGRRLGMPADQLETLALAALLHGIGKVSLPGEILMKAGPLSEAEQFAVRNHVQIGEEFFEGLEHLEPLRPVLRAHHERYDGDRQATKFPAYPDGLAGERIPLAARILKLAEAADTIVTGLPWRQAHSGEEAREIIQRESGHSFDPRLVNILLADGEWLEVIDKPEQWLSRFYVEI